MQGAFGKHNKEGFVAEKKSITFEKTPTDLAVFAKLTTTSLETTRMFIMSFSGRNGSCF